MENQETISKEYLVKSILAHLESLEVADETQGKALEIVKKLFLLYFDGNTEANIEQVCLQIFGYGYFVSKGQDFLYNLSYMNAKIDEYSSFIKRINAHLDLIVQCANELISSLGENFLQKYRIVFDELIGLTFNKEENVWECSMTWSNFSSIVKWKCDRGILQIESKESDKEVALFTEEYKENHFPTEDLSLFFHIEIK